MQVTLVDTHRKSLMPLSLTRPISDLTVGIDRIVDKWRRHTDEEPRVLTARYLGRTREEGRMNDASNLWVSASVLPSAQLVDALAQLAPGEAWVKDGFPVGGRLNGPWPTDVQTKIDEEAHLTAEDLSDTQRTYAAEVDIIRGPADIFSLNDAVLRRDFRQITKNYRTADTVGDAYIKGTELCVSDGAILNRCILNTETGPIFIGKNAEIMEGAVIRGPFSLGESSTVKMGAKIYGATTVGAHCKVGGEVNNVVMHDYSNKGHDGFLGNSVIGSWCNLGADTNTSNLKNNYGHVRVWNYDTEAMEDTGRQFHGLIMGDHSKTGINTMLNTGTVIGVSANVFGGGFPPKFIPSFRWGSPESGFEAYRPDKAMEAATAMMARRGVRFGPTDRKVFEVVSERDARYDL